MTAHIDFFFDLSSPWTRLAFRNIRPSLDGLDYEITWRPFLVGGVFNAVNPSVYESRKPENAARLARSFGWLREWAELAGVAMNFPSEHHPVKSVHAMRFCCALENDQQALERFAGAAFEAYFTEGRNLDDPAVLAVIADEIGMDGAALTAQAGNQPVKDRLRANTQEAIERGAYGSPTLFVSGPGEGAERMYFGNDQLPLVRHRVTAIG